MATGSAQPSGWGQPYFPQAPRAAGATSSLRHCWAARRELSSTYLSSDWTARTGRGISEAPLFRGPPPRCRSRPPRLPPFLGVCVTLLQCEVQPLSQLAKLKETPGHAHCSCHCAWLFQGLPYHWQSPLHCVGGAPNMEPVLGRNGSPRHKDTCQRIPHANFVSSFWIQKFTRCIIGGYVFPFNGLS